jgi:hypothetical protein
MEASCRTCEACELDVNRATRHVYTLAVNRYKRILSLSGQDQICTLDIIPAIYLYTRQQKRSRNCGFSVQSQKTPLSFRHLHRKIGKDEATSDGVIINWR